MFYNPNVCTMYSLYRNEPLQMFGIKNTNLTDIMQLILITLFSVIYFKSAILFGAAALLCSVIIVDWDWLLLQNKRILQVFKTVNIINKVYYKVCRISCYIRKTFMKIWSVLRQFYISGKISCILNSDWGWLLITE